MKTLLEMERKTAFLFPGQGSQTEGMLHTLPSDDPHVRQVFADSEEVLGVPVYSLDTADKLSSTVFVQICLLIAGVISGRRLMAKGVSADFVAGHSVGAFAAAVIGGVLSFRQALMLVQCRGKWMQEAYPAGYGMAALVGFTEARLTGYLREHNRTHSRVYLANLNAADQQVVAGETKSLNNLICRLQNAGLRKARLLNFSVPSHCELLKDVSAALQREMKSLPVKELDIPYLSNHTARLVKTADQVMMDLWMSIAMPVKWYEGICLLYESGARMFIEMEPSGVLAKIVHASLPDVRVLTMEKDNLESVLWLWDRCCIVE
jgi:malonate decarboxylase epsilon subunit